MIETTRLAPAVLVSPALRRWKRLKSGLEWVETVLLLPFALPVIALAAMAIKLEDGGPVFHRRRVVGPGGEFDAFKLRTMRVDADQILASNPALAAEFSKNFKLKDDPRVTRVGNYLRKKSVDELPQLFNVLNGQMSLVGPRMVTPPELDKYGAKQEIFRLVRPGLTGYWQVSGRQEVSYQERVEMDVFYVENWSLGFDYRILARTFWKVLTGEGAY